MVTHDEIQEMLARMNLKLNRDLTANLFDGYVKHMAKKVTLPNAGSGREAPSSSGFMKVECGEKKDASAPIKLNVVDQAGEQEKISVNIVEIK